MWKKWLAAVHSGRPKPVKRNFADPKKEKEDKLS